MDKPAAWAAFAVCVGILLTLDLGVFHRRKKETTAKDAALWSALWIGLALAFNAGVFLVYGGAPAMQFLTGYLLEKALSVDNLFMFLAIFALFRVDPKLQHKALFWGVLGALVMRGFMIAGGIALLARFHWLVYVFGLSLIALSVPMMAHGGAESEPKGFLRLVLSRLPGAVDDDSGAMLARVDGRLRPTRLLVAVLAIELVDLLFALESVPAVIAITTDPFIVYTSNVFAILGLRSLYFALAGVMRLFSLLHYGLGLVIFFIGLKMVVSPLYAVPVQVSLAVVAVILGVSVLASVVWTGPRTASGPGVGGWDFGRRVAAGLLLSTALTAIMAAAAARTVTSLAQSKNKLLDASGRQMIAVDRARLAEAQRVGAARGYLLTGDPSFRRRYLEDDRRFIAALAVYGALDTSPETRRLIRGIDRNYQEYRAEFETTMELRRAGKSLPSVAARYEEVVEPQRAQVDRIMSALVAREAAQFERDRTRSDLATFRANALIYGVAALLILTGLKLSSGVSSALSRSYEEAQEAARARGELKASKSAYRELEAVSYAISHNLRAPLRAIDAAARATMAAAGSAEAECERRTLEGVRASVGRMSRMIESLLELLGVTSGPLTRERVDLSAMIAAIFEARCAGLARRPRFFVDPGLRCEADPRLLQIALEKLVDNAVKFSSKAADPLVEAGQVPAEGGPAFFVRDNGAGFDMSHAARLFVAFQRLHRADEFPGAGMGLPVVGRIIERHGGRVWAEAAPGRGAAFYFTLP